MKKEIFNINCTIDTNFNSNKFLKLRLKVCHDGLNKNNCYLSMKAIDKAKDSIQLIPILARIYKNENGEYQFAEHDMHLETNAFDDTKVKIIYDEIPIGFIPKDCNYEIIQDNNNGRNYVLVDGYVWKDYSNYAEEILKRDETINLSMEINVNSYENNSSEDGKEYFNITDFTYSGITLLGDNYEPAMYDVYAKLITFALNKGISIEDMEKELNNIDINNNTLKKHTIDFLSTFLSNEEKLIQNMLSLRNDENHEYFVINTISTEKNNEHYVYYWCLKSKLGYCQKYTVSENGTITFIDEPIEASFINRDTINIFNSQMNNLQLEVEELRQFKKQTIEEKNNYEKKNEIDAWNELLENNQEFEEIKNQLDKYSLKDIKTKCKCLFADIQLKSITAKKKSKEFNDNLVNFSINQSNKNEYVSDTDLFIEKFKNN